MACPCIKSWIKDSIPQLNLGNLNVSVCHLKRAVAIDEIYRAMNVRGYFGQEYLTKRVLHRREHQHSDVFIFIFIEFSQSHKKMLLEYYGLESLNFEV